MTKCRVIKIGTGDMGAGEMEYCYGWDGLPDCKCIMSKIEGKKVDLDKLKRMLICEEISKKEYDAIRELDGETGSEEDLKIIREVADRYDIALEIEA